MASSGNLPLSVITIILLIAPGLLGIDIYFRVSKRSDSLSRIHWIAYSSVVSLVSLIALYLLTPLYFRRVRDFTNTVAQTSNMVTIGHLSNITLANALSFYLIHLILAGVLGIIIGLLDDKVIHSDRSLDRRDAWQYAFNVVPSDGEEVEVTMTDGTVIQGEYNEQAWDGKHRELFLENPYEVVYSEGGGEVTERHDLGRSTLLHERSLSRIVFTEEDPYSEKAEEISTSGEEAPELPEELESFIQKADPEAKLMQFEMNEEGEFETEFTEIKSWFSKDANEGNKEDDES